MPKMIILLALLACVLTVTETQADTGIWGSERIYISSRVGLNLATHAGPGANDQSVSASYKLGFTVGGAAELRLTEHWAVLGEIVFARKGPDTTKDGLYFGTFRMSYLEIPLLARVEQSVHERIDVYSVLGPALGILLDADIDLADGRHFDLGGFKLIDTELMFGAGAAVEIGGNVGAIILDARYSHGLLNIDKTAGPENDDVMNRAFYFTVGYRANLDALLHGFRRKAPPPARKAPATPHAPEPEIAPPAAEELPAPTSETPSSSN